VKHRGTDLSRIDDLSMVHALDLEGEPELKFFKPGV